MKALTRLVAYFSRFVFCATLSLSWLLMQFPQATLASAPAARRGGAAVVKAAATPRTELAARASAKAQRRAQSAYDRLPLRFEANRGQADSQARFIARGNGYSLLLTPTAAVMRLQGDPAPRSSSRKASAPHRAKPTPATGTAAGELRMQLLQASSLATLAGSDPLPGKSNYFIGTDPRNWMTDVPHFAAVRYAAIYPGIDLVYHGQPQQLEYDFVISSGADPHAIAFAFEGAKTMRVEAGGQLVLSTSAGPVRYHKPVAYQEVNGVRKKILCGYGINRNNEVRFNVGAYDKRKPLVIDPVVTYSTYLGGGGHDIGHAIAVDAEGNAYVAGETGSPELAAALGTASPIVNQSTNAFIAKLNATGTALLYSTYIGGAGFDRGLAIALDAAGNAYVTGRTDSSQFPVTPNATQRTAGGGDDAFVSKLNRDGNLLIYSTYLGGENLDAGLGIAVDATGSAYVTGFTSSLQFPVSPNLLQSWLRGSVDGFVSKLNLDGSSLVYSTYFGGSGRDEGHGIALDATRAIIVGYSDSTDFAVTASALQPTPGGSGDGFMLKLNGGGDQLVYATYLGGSGDDVANSVALDAAGDVYITGGTASKDFPVTAGVFQGQLRGLGDGFVTKLNPTGTARIYSTYFGGEGIDESMSIATDPAGNVYLTGTTNSAQLFTTPDALQAALGGNIDAFLARLNATGKAITYSTYIGGASVERSGGVAVDNVGDAYATGFSVSANFPTTPAALQPLFHGGYDAYVIKVAEPVDLSVAVTAAPGFVKAGSAVTFTVTVRNNGPVTATAVAVTVGVAGGANITLCNATDAGVCGGAGNTRVITFPAIAAAATATVTIQAQLGCLPVNSIISASATVGSFTPEVLVANNSAMATATVITGDALFVPVTTSLDFDLVDPQHEVAITQSKPIIVRNDGCAPLVVGIRSIKRNITALSAGDQAKFDNLNDKKFFTTRKPRSIVIQPQGGTGSLTLSFKAQIPDPAQPPQLGAIKLTADDVLPDHVKTDVTLFAGDGARFTLPVSASVTTAVKMFSPVAGAPLVKIERLGNEFIVTYTLYDSNLDVQSATYTFFDKDGKQVKLKAAGSELGDDIINQGVVRGQSFTVIQRFLNAKDHSDVARVEVTVKDGETAITASGSIK